MQCKVKLCGRPHTHVTAGHQCANCRCFGHGVQKCGRFSEMKRLHGYRNDRIPILDRCKIEDCIHPELHKTEGHECAKCSGFGHECEDYIQNSTNYFQHQHPYFNLYAYYPPNFMTPETCLPVLKKKRGSCCQMSNMSNAEHH